MSDIIPRPQFPPKFLNFEEIINESLRKHRTGRSSKTPNAFLLYRKECTATFKNSNKHISTLSSEAWNTEAIRVKNAYKKFADEINEKVRKQIPFCFVGNRGIDEPDNYIYEIHNEDYNRDLVNYVENNENVTSYSQSEAINPNFAYYML
ncbi:4658_t:CDS:1 [Scutellospora calospora]|uniref:4658_t:CDS:1 n=1 Tax=Scutellospora calospora TaxID=85575 RepID=A0ACA9KMC2_9GLOM|nr:4658_t:CDS:1 [Scutellospora calospora]